jgi:hypothetical protein
MTRERTPLAIREKTLDLNHPNLATLLAAAVVCTIYLPGAGKMCALFAR